MLQIFFLNKNIPRASIFPFLSIVGDFQFSLRPFPVLTANRRVQRLLSNLCSVVLLPSHLPPCAVYLMLLYKSMYLLQREYPDCPDKISKGWQSSDREEFFILCVLISWCCLLFNLGTGCHAEAISIPHFLSPHKILFCINRFLPLLPLAPYLLLL